MILALLPTLAAAESVTLAWDPPSSGTVASYVVERGTASGTYTSTATVAGTATTYVASGLNRGTSYYFIVRAIGSGGLQSTPSNQVTVLLPVLDTSTPPPTDPPTTPTITTVQVASESALQSAVASLRSNTTIVIAAGTYRLTKPLTMTGGLTDVQLKGATSRSSDVVLIGPPATSSNSSPHAIVASRITRLTLSNFAITQTRGYAIQLGTDVQQPTLRGMRIVDNGQFVQSVLHASGQGASGGLVENCSFELLGAGVNLPSGLDLRGIRDWQIRLNRFVDTAPSTTITYGPVVHAWQGAVNTLVERNTFVNASREIAFGLSPRTPNQHSGGTIRNNMIVRRAATGMRGPAISVLDAPSAVIVHNTALLAGTSSVAVDFAHPDTRSVTIANNLFDGSITARDSATATVQSNYLQAIASMFVSATTGDLRLSATKFTLDGSNTYAASILDMAWLVSTVTIDHGGESRPAGPAPDLGADELPRR